MVETEAIYLDAQDNFDLFVISNTMSEQQKVYNQSKTILDALNLKSELFLQGLSVKYKFPEGKVFDRFDKTEKGVAILLKDKE